MNQNRVPAVTTSRTAQLSFVHSADNMRFLVSVDRGRSFVVFRSGLFPGTTPCTLPSREG